jgi:hypothetical protein
MYLIPCFQLEDTKSSLKAVQTERDQAKAASDGLAQELARKISANEQLETEATVLHAKVMDLKTRVRMAFGYVLFRAFVGDNRCGVDWCFAQLDSRGSVDSAQVAAMLSKLETVSTRCCCTFLCFRFETVPIMVV